MPTSGHIDPRTPCYILCPPVSETHRGGSTGLEKGGQSKCPQEPGGKESKRIKAPGEDHLHLSGLVKKQDALFMTWSHVYKIATTITKNLQLCITKRAYTYAYVCSVTESSWTLCNHMDCNSPGSSAHEILPGKNFGLGCHSLLQGIFTTQGWNPHL